MKTYVLSLFESFTWRLMSGSIAWMISSFVLVTLLAAGTASATTRTTHERLSPVQPVTTTTQAVEPAPTVLDEMLNIITRMTTQTERVVSKRL